jgi:hypothetical protein
MCLDIDPSSVIHKHLREKLINLNRRGAEGRFQALGVTILPSFHISLQTPEDWKLNKTRCQKKEKEINYSLNYHTSDLNIVPIIGDITLAPICISEQSSKKSAWIPLNPTWIIQHVNSHLEDGEHTLLSDSLSEDLHLHISLANLTGNPHDSIARPEDCIVDTINN